MIKLSIVVVFYNEFELLINCIHGLQADAPKNTEIIVVDNHSQQPKTKQVIQKLKNIIYIRNEKNLGFAAGANVGFKKAKGEYLLFSTPDLQLIKGTMQKTLAFMQQHPKVGAVGCRVLSPGNTFHPSVFKRFPHFATHMFEYNYIYYKLKTKNNPSYHPDFYTKKEHEQELKPQHMIGAYILMKQKAAKQVGFFDERFFLYREETDFCWKLKNAGWEIAYLPVGGVTHVSNPKRHTITQTHPHYQKSTYLFYKKYYGLWYTLVLWVTTVISVLLSIGFLFGIFMYKSIRRQHTQAKQLLRFYFSIFNWQIKRGFLAVFS